MKSNTPSPDSDVSLKSCLKNIKKEFEVHKEELIKLKEEKANLVDEVAQLKEVLKNIQHTENNNNKSVKDNTLKASKDIFSVVKSLVQTVGVLKDKSSILELENEEINETNNVLLLEKCNENSIEKHTNIKAAKVVVAHKCCSKKELLVSASKSKRKIESPLSSLEMISSSSLSPNEGKMFQESQTSYVKKGNVKKKKKLLNNYTRSVKITEKKIKTEKELEKGELSNHQISQ